MLRKDELKSSKMQLNSKLRKREHVAENLLVYIRKTAFKSETPSWRDNKVNTHTHPHVVCIFFMYVLFK